MKHIKTFEGYLGEAVLNEAKKEKFLLYTNPNNSTNRAYVAIGSAKVKDAMSSAKKYSGSYQILHQGSGTNDDLQKAIKMYSNYNFGDVKIDEGFLSEAVNSSPNNFLRAFNYQPFDDWYKMYNRFVEGDLEPEDSEWEEFIEETESIMKFLEKALQKSK